MHMYPLVVNAGATVIGTRIGRLQMFDTADN